MLLLLVPQGTASTALDASASVDDSIYRLGLASSGDFASIDWISPAELYQFADDALKRLARTHGLFVQYDTSVAVLSGTAVYTLPSGHVFTILAALVPPSGAITFLRASTVPDLFALDAAWSAASGTPVRYSEDAVPAGGVQLYPKPSANGTLALVAQKVPATVAAGATTIALPTPFSGMVTFAMLEAALSKESDHARREMAAHYGAMGYLYGKILTQLYGSGA